jgi:glycosyltransferase involved in cell wall biosynthesis
MLKAVILTLNEATHIAACIESVKWADGVVVFDSFSTDATVELARQAGADILQHPFENYAQQRNAALEAVAADWIFFVDADERATPALAQEIRQVIATEDKVGWWIPRHNYIFGTGCAGPAGGRIISCGCCAGGAPITSAPSTKSPFLMAQRTSERAVHPLQLRNAARLSQKTTPLH